MRYIRVENIEDGMTIARDIKDVFGRILITKGTKLSRQNIDKLKQFKLSGIYIVDDWSADIFIEASVNKELVNKSIQSLQEFNLEKIQDCAYTIVDKLLSAEGYMNDIETLKEYDENTYEHSLNVAVASVTMGIGLGYSFERLRNLAVGALMHDIGKKLVPIEVIAKNGKLNKDEYSTVKKHPEYGYSILKQDIGASASTRQIVYQHHENYDGSGYPRGLKGDDIYELAMVTHICDVYDALVSKRSYKDAFSFKDTIKILMDEKDKMFSSDLLERFFEVVPIYHKGTEVTLSNGKKALVFKNNKGNMLKPTVKLKDGTYIDLRESYISIIS